MASRKSGQIGLQNEARNFVILKNPNLRLINNYYCPFRPEIRHPAFRLAGLPAGQISAAVPIRCNLYVNEYSMVEPVES